MDKLEYYKDKDDDWRWKRTAPNNEEVGGATEGYKHFQDCEANALRINGAPDDLQYIDPKNGEVIHPEAK